MSLRMKVVACATSVPWQVRRNAHVEILPLSTGCLGACTYCKTRHARGALGSYEPSALVARARQALADPLVRPCACPIDALRLLQASVWFHSVRNYARPQRPVCHKQGLSAQPAMIQASGPSLPQAGSHCKVILSAWQPQHQIVAVAASEAENVSVQSTSYCLKAHIEQHSLHYSVCNSCARTCAGAVAVKRGLGRIRL